MSDGCSLPECSAPGARDLYGAPSGNVHTDRKPLRFCAAHADEYQSLGYSPQPWKPRDPDDPQLRLHA